MFDKIVFWISLTAFAVAVSLADSPEASCDTDADCMRHCPPPADDPDCDGGPR